MDTSSFITAERLSFAFSTIIPRAIRSHPGDLGARKHRRIVALFESGHVNDFLATAAMVRRWFQWLDEVVHRRSLLKYTIWTVELGDQLGGKASSSTRHTQPNERARIVGSSASGRVVVVLLAPLVLCCE